MARPVTLSVEGHPTLLTTGFLSEVENKPDSVTDSVWIVAQCHPPCAVKSIALKNQASAFVTVWGVQSAEVSPLPASVLEHAHLLIPCTQLLSLDEAREIDQCGNGNVNTVRGASRVRTWKQFSPYVKHYALTHLLIRFDPFVDFPGLTKRVGLHWLRLIGEIVSPSSERKLETVPTALMSPEVITQPDLFADPLPALMTGALVCSLVAPLGCPLVAAPSPVPVAAPIPLRIDGLVCSDVSAPNPSPVSVLLTPLAAPLQVGAANFAKPVTAANLHKPFVSSVPNASRPRPVGVKGQQVLKFLPVPP